jgi:hypothetical protein
MKKLTVILAFIVSCTTYNDNNFIQLDLSNNKELHSPEILFRFDDKYPVSISVKDSLIYIIQREAEKRIMVMDINSKQIVYSLGNAGHGPDDVLTPLFINSLKEHSVLLEDVSLKKFLTIETDSAAKIYVLQKYIDYPVLIFPSGETNISENYIVGRRVGTGKMLYIYNRKTQVITDVDFFPVQQRFMQHDPNYVYAPSIAINEDKNRIIAGMYLFDIFHVYDFNGNRINTFCFSDDCIPHFDYDNLMQNVEECKYGLIRSFATDNYCYFMRIENDNITKTQKQMIIQLNWEGELVNAYSLTDEIEGQFYVSEKENKIYTIRHIVESEKYEIYEIVSYLLN